MKKKYDESEGVWRTIGGRRVFIRKGQSLSEAMKDSGKFKNKDEEKSKKTNTIPRDYDKITYTQKIESSGGKVGDKFELTRDEYGQTITKNLRTGETYQANMSMLRSSEAVEINDIIKQTKNDKYQNVIDKMQEKGTKKFFEKEYNIGNNDSLEEYLNKYGDSYKGSDVYVLDTDSAEIDYRYYALEELTNNQKNAMVIQGGENGVTVVSDEWFKNDNVYVDNKDYDTTTRNLGNASNIAREMGDYKNAEILKRASDISKENNRIADIEKKLQDIEWQGERGARNDGHLNYNENYGTLTKEYKELTGKDYKAPFKQGVYKEKKTGNDYLPKASKVETAGTSNRKEVSDNIQAHILDYYDNPVDFMEQMDAMDYYPTKWHAGQEMAKGGSYLIYYDDQRDFLNSLNINPKGKDFSDDRVFEVYTSLVGRESERLYNRLEKLYEQYKKEHKGSDVSLDDFRKWFK